MLSAVEIKQKLVTALQESSVFTAVLTPPDDRKNSTIMNEPCSAVYYSGFCTGSDNGIPTEDICFDVYMKFLKTGVNETADDLKLAIDAVSTLEPYSLKQKKVSEGNKQSAMYLMEITFRGCRQ